MNEAAATFSREGKMKENWFFFFLFFSFHSIFFHAQQKAKLQMTVRGIKEIKKKGFV
jgi:hypothetical protein